MKKRQILKIILVIWVVVLFFPVVLTYGGGESVVTSRIVWSCGEATSYPINITDGSWNTAVLSTEGLIDPSSIRVEVDGLEVDYWMVNFNTDHTSIWVNLNFAPNEIIKDIEIHYDESAMPAYVPDDNYKPAFNLPTSTNAVWDYNEFGDSNGLRSGSWSFEAPDMFGAVPYTANHNTNADPWEVLGVASDTVGLSSGRWSIHNPCGITNANFKFGESYTGVINSSLLIGMASSLESSNNGLDWVNEYQIPPNTIVDTWSDWGQNQPLAAGVTFVGMNFNYLYSNNGVYLEADDVVLDITASPIIILDHFTYYFPILLND